MNTKTSKFLAIIAVLAMAFAVVAVVSESGESDAGTAEGHFYYTKDPANGTVTITIGETEQDADFQPVAGNVLKFTTTPDEGFYLSSFTYAIGAGDPTDVTGDLTVTPEMVGSYVNFTAVFSAIPTITYDDAPANGHVSAYVGSNLKASGSQILPGTTVLVSATADPGYRLTKLEAGAVDITATGYFIMPAGDVVITPTIKKLFTVEFPENVDVKVSGVSIASGDEVTEGTNLAITVTAPAGKYLKTFENGVNPVVTAPVVGKVANTYTATIPDVNADVSLEATFDDKFDVTVPEAPENGTITVIGDGVLATGETTGVVKNQFINIIAVPNDGYMLKTLTVNGESIKSGAGGSFTVTEDAVIAVEFDHVVYEVNALALANCDVTVQKKVGDADPETMTGAFTVNVGDKVIITVAPKTGYDAPAGLHYIKTGGAAVDFAEALTTTITITDHGIIGITADTPAAQHVYAVTAPGAGEHVAEYTVSPATKYYGTEVTVTITPDAGYRVTGLTIEGVTGTFVEGATIATGVSNSTFVFNMPAKDIVAGDFTVETEELYQISATGGAGLTYLMKTGTGYSVTVTAGDTWIKAGESVKVSITAGLDLGETVVGFTATVAAGTVDVDFEDGYGIFAMPEQNVTTLTADIEASYLIEFESSVMIVEVDGDEIASGDYILPNQKVTVTIKDAALDGKLLTSLKYIKGSVWKDIENDGAVGTFTSPANATEIDATLSDAYEVIFEGGDNYTLTVEYNNQIIASGTKVIKGQTIKAYVTPAANYAVTSFTANDVAITSGVPVIINDDTEIEVEVTANYKITIPTDANGSIIATVDGANVASGANVLAGKIVELEINFNEGYEVTGLLMNGDDILDDMEFEMPEANAVITVVIEKITYTVTFEDTEDGTVSVKYGNVDVESGVTPIPYGASVTVTVSPEEGKKITHVYYNDVEMTNGGSIVITDDVEIDFTADSLFTVTYVANGATAGDVPVDPTFYENGATVTVLGKGDLVKEGYLFAGWKSSADSEIYNAGETFAISSNVTLTAQWGETCQVEWDAAQANVTSISVKIGNVSIGNGDYIAKGSMITITYTLATGYSAQSATYTMGDVEVAIPAGEFEITDDITAITITAYKPDVKYTVSWTANDITVTYNQAEIVSGAEVLENGVITVTVTPVAGKVLKGVKYTIGETTTAAAKISENNYQITVTGNISAITTEYESGNSITTEAIGIEGTTVTYTVDGVKTTSADAGKTVRIQVTPTIGYKIDSIKWKAVGAADYTDVTKTQAFVMPDQAVTVKVTLAKDFNNYGGRYTGTIPTYVNGNGVLTSDAIIEEGATFIVPEGTTLNMNGYSIYVYGTFEVSAGAALFWNNVDYHNEALGAKSTIFISPLADVTADGIIGTGDNAITVKATKANPESATEVVYAGTIETKNVTGIELEFVEYTKAFTTEKLKILAVSGTLVKYSGMETGKKATFAVDGVIIDDLTVGTGVTFTPTNSVLINGATLTVQGTFNGAITAEPVSMIDISGGNSSATITAYTGKVLTTVKNPVAANFGTTQVAFTAAAGAVIETTFTTEKSGTKTYNVYGIELSGKIGAATSTATVGGAVAISGNAPAEVDNYKPLKKITVKDLTVEYVKTGNITSTITATGVTFIVDGKISMSKVAQFTANNLEAASAYTTYTTGKAAEITGAYVTDFATAFSEIANATDKTITQWYTMDVKDSIEMTDGKIIISNNFKVSGELKVTKGTIEGTIKEVTGKLTVLSAATVAQPTKFDVKMKTGNDVAYCGLQKAIDESAEGAVIELNNDVEVKKLTIPEKRTIDTMYHKLTVKGTLTIDGTLKATALVKAYNVVVNGTFESPISGESDLEIYDASEVAEGQVKNLGSLTVAGKLNFAGDVKVEGAFTVSGEATVAKIVGNNNGTEAALANSLDVSGKLKTTDDVAIAKKATVAGEVVAEKDFAVTGDFKVTGLVTIDGDLIVGTDAVADADATKFVVTGSVAVTGGLFVAGNCDASAGFVAVKGVTTPSENATYTGAFVSIVNDDTYGEYDIYTSVETAVLMANLDLDDNLLAKVVSIHGKVTAGDIELASGVSLFIADGADVTIKSIEMDVEEVEAAVASFEQILVAGTLTADVSGPADAVVKLSKVTGLTINARAIEVGAGAAKTIVYQTVLTVNNAVAIIDSIEIAEGTVILDDAFMVNTDGQQVGTFVIASGAIAKGDLITTGNVVTNVNGEYAVAEALIVGKLNVTGTLTVPAGSALAVTGDASITGTLAIAAADEENNLDAGEAGFLVLSIKGTADVAGELIVGLEGDNDKLDLAGTMNVTGEVNVEAAASVTISGTLNTKDKGVFTADALTITGTVSADADAKVIGKNIVIGEKATSLGATATVNKIYLKDNNSFVTLYAGSDATVVSANGKETVSTAIVINDILYANVYVPYGSNIQFDDVFAQNEFDDIKGIDTEDLYNDLVEAANGAAIGSIPTISAKADVNMLAVKISIASHISVFIDGVKVENAEVEAMELGKHTLKIQIDAGYKGTTEATFDGKKVTDSFTVTTDMISAGKTILLSVYGDIVVDHGDEPIPGETVKVTVKYVQGVTYFKNGVKFAVYDVATDIEIGSVFTAEISDTAKYTGDPVINGQHSYIIDKEVTLEATGVETVSIGNEGINLTDILLIVLVILIAVMVIIVVLRMNRS